MKNFVLIALLLISFTGMAQVNQGTLFAGGSTSFQFGKVTEEFGTSSFTFDYMSYNFAPQFGYFIADDIVIGPEIRFNGTKIQDDSGSENKSSALGLGLFARYYFGKIYIEAGGGLENQVSEFIDGGTGGSDFTDKNGGPYYHAGVGYMLFITESVALEPMIGYFGNSWVNDDFDDEKVKSGLFDFSLGISVYIER